MEPLFTWLDLLILSVYLCVYIELHHSRLNYSVRNTFHMSFYSKGWTSKSFIEDRLHCVENSWVVIYMGTFGCPEVRGALPVLNPFESRLSWSTLVSLPVTPRLFFHRRSGTDSTSGRHTGSGRKPTFPRGSHTRVPTFLPEIKRNGLPDGVDGRPPGVNKATLLSEKKSC